MAGFFKRALLDPLDSAGGRLHIDGMPDLNCPNCGTSLPAAFSVAKMATCPSCDTTLFLDGAAIRDAGQSGEMHDAPLLMRLGDAVRVKQDIYDVLGHARFDYGRGWWDEFWVQGAGGDAWISVDEGDVIFQRPAASGTYPSMTQPPALGERFEVFGTRFRVTEAASAVCIAVRGMFAEELKVGSHFSYVNCTSADGSLLSGEFSTGAPDWYYGDWLDPFELPLMVRA